MAKYPNGLRLAPGLPLRDMGWFISCQEPIAAGVVNFGHLLEKRA